MTAIQYKTKNGDTRFKPSLTQDEYVARQFDGNPGFCLACGEEADGCEPDARQYECESCGAKKVYGLEELLMMGLLEIQ